MRKANHVVVITLVISVLLGTIIVAASADFTDHGQILGADSISDLQWGEDGKLYGALPFKDLFVFNPADQSVVAGQLPSSMQPLLALTWGQDGELYGGGWWGTLWKYDPETGASTSLVTIPGGRRIISLTTGEDGLIYVGTERQEEDNEGKLFAFNPVTLAVEEIGGITGETSLGYGLITAPGGKIYGGTLRNAYLFSYDPGTDTFLDLGQPVPGENSVGALAVGADGKIYGGTQPSGHLFAFDPKDGTVDDKGQAVAGQSRLNALAAFAGKVYGATGTFDDNNPGHVFVYDISAETIMDLGIPVNDVRGIGSLEISPSGMLYGGTHFGTAGGHLFSTSLLNPELTINYTTGAPGSVFTLEVTDFPPNQTATVWVNGHFVGDANTGVNGEFTVLLSTDNADEGVYLVTIQANPELTTRFELTADGVVHSAEGEGPVFAVPEGIAFTTFAYLPSVIR